MAAVIDRRARPAALVVVGALGAAALVPPVRLPLLVALIALTILAPAVARWRWAVAAGVPVALILTWGGLLEVRMVPEALVCADLLSPVARSRVLEAVLVIAAIGLLARFLGTTVRELGLPRPRRQEVVLGLVAIVIIPLPAIYLGSLLAEPFFGPMNLDLAQPTAAIPALTLAIANGTMEELAYRGALMAWMSRAAGPAVGLGGQALVFGLAHTGADFTGPQLPVVAFIVVAGLAAGLIVRRTGSLWFVIAAHIAFDVPLYFAAACRLPGS